MPEPETEPAPILTPRTPAPMAPRILGSQPTIQGALIATAASAGAGIAVAYYTKTPWWVVLGSGIVWNLTVGVPKVNALAAVGAFAVYKWLR